MRFILRVEAPVNKPLQPTRAAQVHGVDSLEGVVVQKWEYAIVIAWTKLISVQAPAESFNVEPGNVGPTLNKLGQDG